MIVLQKLKMGNTSDNENSKNTRNRNNSDMHRNTRSHGNKNTAGVVLCAAGLTYFTNAATASCPLRMPSETV